LKRCAWPRRVKQPQHGEPKRTQTFWLNSANITFFKVWQPLKAATPGRSKSNSSARLEPLIEGLQAENGDHQSPHISGDRADAKTLD
jgi:hypothetical protein